jgi:hypothetical protein
MSSRGAWWPVGPAWPEIRPSILVATTTNELPVLVASYHRRQLHCSGGEWRCTQRQLGPARMPVFAAVWICAARMIPLLQHRWQRLSQGHAAVDKRPALF